jgi:hypothetical protein
MTLEDRAVRLIVEPRVQLIQCWNEVISLFREKKVIHYLNLREQ